MQEPGKHRQCMAKGNNLGRKALPYLPSWRYPPRPPCHLFTLDGPHAAIHRPSTPCRSTWVLAMFTSMLTCLSLHPRSISVLVMFTSLSLIAGSLQMSEGGTVKASSCGSRLSCLGGKVTVLQG